MGADFPSPRAQDIFLEARRRPRETREAWLRETCGDDADLYRSVEALLESDEGGGALEPPSPATVASWFGPTALPDVSGMRIGSCRIVGRIAEGGMGRVYEAVQEPPGRRVAVKLLRQALPDDLSRARFEDEARLLAAIDHPGVCRVFEAGTWASDGGEPLPYCVMELIEDAKPVTAFAAEMDLSIADRVRLLIEVCAAVSASHAKGVLHRDLKPGNVLVGRDGRAKVIDFGIARTLDDRGRAHGRLTRSGMLLGTPAYMSAEQLLGRPEDVDVRTDVHALGVILYETLTGRLPRDLGDGSLGAAIQALRDQRPVPPDRVDPRIARDLGAVAMKAVESDPTRRYSSVADLSADLSRWLESKPVTARPPGAWRAAALWVRRHRAVAALSALLALALAGGATFATISAQRERAARETADGERDRADQSAKKEHAAREAADQERERAEGFLRAGKDFIPWILDDHQRAVSALPRSLPVVRDLVKGVRDHLRSLSYEESSDPALLLSAARSYSLLADVEGGFGGDAVGLREAAREDAGTAIRLAQRVRAVAPALETFEIEAGAEILLSRLASAGGDMDGAWRHAEAAAAVVKAEGALAKGLPGGARASVALQTAILRGDLLGARGEPEKSLEAYRQGLEGVVADGNPAVSASVLMDAYGKTAQTLIRLGRGGEANEYVERIERTAGEREKDSGWAVDARSDLFRSYVRLGDSAQAAGASPVPWFDRALAALSHWREAAPGSATIDREEAALRKRRGAVLLDESRYEEGLDSLRRADALCATLLKDDPNDPLTWEVHVEANLIQAEIEQRLGHLDAMGRQMQIGENLARHVVESFPKEKEAWLARCRLVLTKSALDTVAGEGEQDPAKRRALLEKAVEGTLEGGALYREAVEHGLEHAVGASIASACDAEAERIRKEIARIGTR